MKIGIYLGFNDGVNLTKEGLGHYLADLLEIFQMENDIVVACPKWLVKEVRKLCKEFRVETGRMEYIVENRIPILLQVYFWMKYGNKQKRKKNFDARVLLGLFKKLVMKIILSTNIFVILFMILICFFISILMVIPMGVLFIIMALGMCIRKCGHIVKKCMRFLFSGMAHVRWTKKYYERFRNNINKEYITDGMQKLYLQLLEKVRMNLVEEINRSGKDVDIWYSPTIFWPEFNKIHGGKITVVPDLVMAEFPLQWGDISSTKDLYSSYKKMICDSNCFITYCECTKRNLLMRKFGKDENRIWVIPHKIHDLSKYVTLIYDNSTILDRAKMEARINRDLLENMKPYIVDMHEYMRGFRMSDIRYLFFASQNRPHKNILNLIKAYEYLLREKYLNVKLFLTMNWNINISENIKIKDYIYEKDLQYDVLAFHDVDVKGLAALYHEAELVVNPTLFEGGFPYTFGEGMSVGVPSVMSNIPQVREFTDRFDLEEMLFDPYNYKDIARSIEYGLSHRDLLIRKERALFVWMMEEFSEERQCGMYQALFEQIQSISSDSAA